MRVPVMVAWESVVKNPQWRVRVLLPTVLGGSAALYRVEISDAVHTLFAVVEDV